MLDEKHKIISLVRIIPIGAVILISISLIIVSILGINKYFNDATQKEIMKLKYDTIYQAKKRVKATYGLIDSINSIVTKSFKRELKVAVQLGNNIIRSIYMNGKKYPKDVMIQKIKDHLNNVRFYRDKSGYFFMYDTKANLLMLPTNPNLEGTNFWDYQDIKGKYVLRDVIHKLEKSPKGIYDRWCYYKPNTYKVLSKLGYVKSFKPLDILLGTAVYDDNMKKEVYKRIIQFISKVDTAIQKRKIIVITKNGDILYSGDRKILRTNQYKKYKEILALSTHNSDKIIQYRMGDKLMIFDYYKPLGLTILQEIDVKKFNQLIEDKKENIKNVVNVVIKQFLITSLIFILIILIITIYLTNMIKKIFENYDKNLKQEKEKAELAAKTKSEFLANMSHEIRTPLNAMFGFIKILEEKENDEESAKYLNIIEKSGQNLLTIINDILDFSKIEAGKFKIEKIEFNPKEEIEVIHELFASKASEKDILLEIKEENLKYNIVSDPTRIKQVIANLLSNAIKFTPENKRVDLFVKYDDKNELFFVEVKDEGIGIAKEKLNTIFEAFSQADTSTTRKYGGTGLGLTISYKLVKLMGGELKVESEEKKGSKFYFEIPAKKGKLAKDVISHKHKMQQIKFNYHILVVEDNLANQMFMKVILNKMGVTFDIANNGIEAIEKFEKNKYDFILMDENMPIMNGIEATKKIRDIERSLYLDHTIIIALTANALEGDKERFILAGMDYYLSKPLDIEKLKELFKKEKK